MEVTWRELAIGPTFPQIYWISEELRRPCIQPGWSLSSSTSRLALVSQAFPNIHNAWQGKQRQATFVVKNLTNLLSDLLSTVPSRCSPSIPLVYAYYSRSTLLCSNPTGHAVAELLNRSSRFKLFPAVCVCIPPCHTSPYVIAPTFHVTMRL